MDFRLKSPIEWFEHHPQWGAKLLIEYQLFSDKDFDRLLSEMSTFESSVAAQESAKKTKNLDRQGLLVLDISDKAEPLVKLGGEIVVDARDKISEQHPKGVDGPNPFRPVWLADWCGQSCICKRWRTRMSSFK